MKSKNPLHPDVWDYIKKLGPTPDRNLTYGKFTAVSPATVARREAEGRKGLAPHEKVLR